MAVRRLGPGDEPIALEMFVTMARVFAEDGDTSEGGSPPDEAYVRRLLQRPDFFALVATDGDVVVGGRHGPRLAHDAQPGDRALHLRPGRCRHSTSPGSWTRSESDRVYRGVQP